jgi:hypothetical protein
MISKSKDHTVKMRIRYIDCYLLLPVTRDIVSITAVNEVMFNIGVQPRHETRPHVTDPLFLIDLLASKKSLSRRTWSEKSRLFLNVEPRSQRARVQQFFPAGIDRVQEFPSDPSIDHHDARISSILSLQIWQENHPRQWLPMPPIARR